MHSWVVASTANVDADLRAVLDAYVTSVRDAWHEFSARTGLLIPERWREHGLARAGRLPGDPPVEYAFHGRGLRIQSGANQVDFDFGRNGDLKWFNPWFVAQFAASNGFGTWTHMKLRNEMERLATIGQLVKEDGLYRLAPVATCPACGFGLDFLPWDGNNPSDEICPCCNVQFGYDDADFASEAGRAARHVEWRDSWIAAGRPWRGVYPPPPQWDPNAQIQARESRSAAQGPKSGSISGRNP